MQISAAIGSITNYKSRITIPDVLFDRNYITSALLTSTPDRPDYVASRPRPYRNTFSVAREERKMYDRETVAGAL